MNSPIPALEPELQRFLEITCGPGFLVRVFLSDEIEENFESLKESRLMRVPMLGRAIVVLVEELGPVDIGTMIHGKVRGRHLYKGIYQLRTNRMRRDIVLRLADGLDP